LTTGMRRGELLALKWSDIDFARGRIAVRRSLAIVDGTPVESPPKTKRGKRSIPIDAATLSVFKELRVRRAEEFLLVGRALRDEDFVFSDLMGRPLHPDAITKRFLTLQRRADLPRIRLHDLRHTHATLALAAGVHPKIVSERLGHASISITLDTYSHAVPSLDEAAAEKVASLILG
jgi:integrase